MTEQKTISSERWAPWWLYVMVLVPTNLAKQAALGDAPMAVNITATVLVVAVGVAVITGLYRAFKKSAA